MNNCHQYSIGEVSRVCDVPIKTLRYYDSIGLLKPEKRNELNNYRYYSYQQLLQVLLIKELKPLGFSLHEISAILTERDLSTLQEQLTQKLFDIERTIETMRSQLDSLKIELNRIADGINILRLHDTTKGSYNEIIKMKIEWIPECQVAYVCSEQLEKTDHFLNPRIVTELRHVLEHYNLCSSGPLMAVLYDRANKHRFHGPEVPEVCLPVFGNKEDCTHVKQFGGFLGATTIYVGRYSGILNTYSYLAEQIEESGYDLGGPPIEQYIVDPIDTDNQSEHVTKIILPLQPPAKENAIIN